MSTSWNRAGSTKETGKSEDITFSNTSSGSERVLSDAISKVLENVELQSSSSTKCFRVYLTSWRPR